MLISAAIENKDFPAAFRTNFSQRLGDLFAFFQDEYPGELPSDGIGTSMQAVEIRNLCIRKHDVHLSWLFLCALAGSFPSEEECRDFHGTLVTCAPTDSLLRLLQTATRTALRSVYPASNIVFVRNTVCVDVDFACQTDFTTGIQRVTRNLVGAWSKQHDFTLVKWNTSHSYFTPLTRKELIRMTGEAPLEDRNQPQTMLIPVSSTIVLPEVGDAPANAALGGLARYSGNTHVAIGYDLIPVTSAVTVTSTETQKFTSYLSAIKYFDKVIAISESAAAEFHGFCQMLESQGLSGPGVLTRDLPIEGIPSIERSLDNATRDVPLILCVGSIEQRKNQRRLLMACEQLWQDGLEFEITLVGYPSLHNSNEFFNDVNELHKRNRPINLKHGITDQELSALYEEASFSVFISTHEGYGLPIAESIAHGLPVVATNYGSMNDIALSGQHISVNPRNLASITAGIREMLKRTAPQRKPMPTQSMRPDSWENYAEDIWTLIHD